MLFVRKKNFSKIHLNLFSNIDLQNAYTIKKKKTPQILHYFLSKQMNACTHRFVFEIPSREVIISMAFLP